MQSEHRYKLDQSSKKYHCPECNKKTFVLYIDALTAEYLPEQYGRCDRESKCNYFLNPYTDGYFKEQCENENGKIWESVKNQKQRKSDPVAINKTVFFDFETFKKTLSNYDQNVFIQNLIHNVAFPFEANEVTKIIELYRLGTVARGYRSGAITFPFIDIHNNVRTIQVKQFDDTNHTKATDFLHSVIEKHCIRNNKTFPEWLEAYTKQDKKVSCLFGEHLLNKFPKNPIALVEAPKTAIYGTLYFGMPETPEKLIWLAVYNKSSFSLEKMEILKGKDVYVFPDLSKDGNTFKEWQSKALKIEKQLPGTKFIFSDLLESLANDDDRETGGDLADVLIKQDWRLFKSKNIKSDIIGEDIQVEQSYLKTTSTQELEKKVSQCETMEDFNIVSSRVRNTDDNVYFHSKQNYRPQIEKNLKKRFAEVWGKDIEDLERFYSEISFPEVPIRLNECSFITDVSKFVQSNLTMVKTNNGNPAYQPYLIRLKKLKQILINK